ncbi:hypothetical protein M5K25_027256 [Dendrobium thyrsiflorum]|uniref:Reverse transcriptase zinc-binding domain-containing protein n=1 Tax=Dendrobium thyrsiflorum TaxID=117978 RepID=A0ABD0TZJ1_DENTH
MMITDLLALFSHGNQWVMGRVSFKFISLAVPKPLMKSDLMLSAPSRAPRLLASGSMGISSSTFLASSSRPALPNKSTKHPKCSRVSNRVQSGSFEFVRESIGPALMLRALHRQPACLLRQICRAPVHCPASGRRAEMLGGNFDSAHTLKSLRSMIRSFFQAFCRIGVGVESELENVSVDLEAGGERFGVSSGREGFEEGGEGEVVGLDGAEEHLDVEKKWGWERGGAEKYLRMVRLYLRRFFYYFWRPIYSKASKFWHHITQVAVKIKSRIQLQVVNSYCPFSFGWDPWCHGMAVNELLHPSFACGLNVADCITEGVWSLPSHLEQSQLDRIYAVPILHSPNPNLCWIGPGKLCFNSFYLHFYSEHPKVPWFKFVWHRRYALRYSSFVWMAILEGLKTADILARRNILIPPLCPLCQMENESISHCFFQCDYAFQVISSLLPSLQNFLMRPTLLQVFDCFEGDISIPAYEKNFCYFVVCCSVYFLWKERNERRFNAAVSPIQTTVRKISHAIHAKTSSWKYIEALQTSFPSCFRDF